MHKTLFGAIGAVVLGIALTVGIIQAGALDFGADRPHSVALAKLIAWARERSVERAAEGIAIPNDLSDPERIRRGVGNYDAMCAQCHLAPGVKDSELNTGLYPAPPSLAQSPLGANSKTTDAVRFWVIKHGIKGSGMPAWAKVGMDDPSIWDLVAFLRTLPNLNAETYREQLQASDGHSHAGIGGHGGESGSPTASEPVAHPQLHEHMHEEHAHSH
jgi:mono/diheme cytochrome c family protein